MTPDRFIAAAFRDERLTDKALEDLIAWHGRDGTKRGELTHSALLELQNRRAAELALESVGDGGLLPCPFCEDGAEVKSVHHRDVSETWVGCLNCTAMTKKIAWAGDGHIKARADSIAAWNTRARSAAAGRPG